MLFGSQPYIQEVTQDDDILPKELRASCVVLEMVKKLFQEPCNMKAILINLLSFCSALIQLNNLC